ncbi:hypothetical protein JOF41_003550 [Saccharothrix coeruleofusca]|uniref:hypothetical protein n=1 Tax=Saccharothrix coeruleofusca TaxID=33919 RepID=UPI001AE972BC|nr:hypothetical protein [Saccharothrix coeruleofusca]MBP2337372.1 hypothetical protein [Saccharothrix coeruleofusca]
MSFDSSYDGIRIPVVSIPSAEPLSGGALLVRWAVETLEHFDADRLLSLAESGFRTPFPGVSFRVGVSRVRNFFLGVVTGNEFPGSTGMDVASIVLRVIDENVGRIWKIGQEPRCFFPEFMRQRRQMLARLNFQKQRNWILLALIRLEPLLSGIVGRGSRVEHLIKMSHRPAVEPSFSEDALIKMTAGISQASVMGASRDLSAEDISDLLALGLKFVEEGLRAGSSDLLAYASERFFESFWMLERIFSEPGYDGVAAMEDRMWFQDCMDLTDSADDRALDRAIERSVDVAATVANFCTRIDLSALGSPKR